MVCQRKMNINQLPEITILDTRVSLTNKNSTLDFIKNYNFNKYFHFNVIIKMVIF